MDVRIDQINVESAGPISNLSLDLQQFNLIYGHNERGKTFLVEFLIRSLFKNQSGWSLRESNSRGKVMVSGLSDKPIGFTPTSRLKLEDLLLEEKPGLPTRINRLLVVKGADLSFEDGQRRNVSRTVLKEFLSGQGVLDDIQGEISATVRGATVDNGHISGKKMGEIKTRDSLSEELRDIDKLFARVETIYSGGERQAMRAKIDELDSNIAEQQLAKRYHAYELGQKIMAKQRQLDQLPKEDLAAIKTDLAKLQDRENLIQRQDAKLAELERESEHYEWLKEAVALYEQRGVQSDVKINPIYLIVIAAALLFAIVFSLLGYPAGTILLVIIAAVGGWLYLRQYRSALEHATEVDEINKLNEEYKNRFGDPLSGLPELRERVKSKEQAYFGANTLREELAEERQKRNGLEEKLVSEINRHVGSSPEREKWESEIGKLIKRREQMAYQRKQYELELAALNIAEHDYRHEQAAVSFNSDNLETYQADLDAVHEDLDNEETELNNLKQRISERTGDDISVAWPILLQNLQEKREKVSAEYRKATATILAGILVDDQLDVIREQEEKTIEEKLESPIVSTPIRDITEQYTGIRYEEGAIWLDYETGSFPLSDLSTGALEQVMLGLRLGFAAQLFDRDRMFLLLDDAFQHADWSRRKRLVNQSAALAKDGWQIIYFTMDDNIRDLFDEAGHKHFPDSYRRHDLNVPSTAITLGE
jgi:recombinational DNA repair ATPase RecF